MAYKIIFSNRFSHKLTSLFFYLEENYSAEVTTKLVEKIDLKIALLSHQPAIGWPSLKVSGVYKVSISRFNKLYYRIKGRKIILLDLVRIANTFKESELPD